MSKILTLFLILAATVHAADSTMPRKSAAILIGQMMPMPPAFQEKKFGNSSADLNAYGYGLSYASRRWDYGRLECWMAYSSVDNKNFRYYEPSNTSLSSTLSLSRFDTGFMLGAQLPIRLGRHAWLMPALSLGPAFSYITRSSNYQVIGLCESGGVEFIYKAFYLEAKARVLTGPIRGADFDFLVSIMPSAGLGFAF